MSTQEGNVLKGESLYGYLRNNYGVSRATLYQWTFRNRHDKNSPYKSLPI